MNDLENRINNALSVYSLASATVQLVDLDVLEKRPNGYGSGMLLRSGDRLLVLSVLHNALLRTSVIQGNCVCRPEGFRMECRKDLIWNYFCDDGFRIDTSRGDPYLDFTFSECPTNATYARWSYAVDSGVRAYPIRRFDENEILEVATESSFEKHDYGLCGTVMPEFDKIPKRVQSLSAEWSTFAAIFGLKFYSSDKYYIYFKLPGSFYELNISLGGTSGAPIISEDGRPVALVCGGEEDESLVRAIRLDNTLHLLSTSNFAKLTIEAERQHQNEFEKFIDEGQLNYYRSILSIQGNG